GVPLGNVKKPVQEAHSNPQCPEYTAASFHLANNGASTIFRAPDRHHDFRDRGTVPRRRKTGPLNIFIDMTMELRYH
ncbi:MAG TPA: hypothetical protein PKY31_14180, partial [Spirochaetota bacterium]|nr:hypothetical protein [Spirochaetota bacterium]